MGSEQEAIEYIQPLIVTLAFGPRFDM
ncbi:hypothetical protein CBM2585_A10057 [Cupriavidus taiwanensis]|nr:hypothetical protein CBM2585_A10057 [Cupriavidus taiwanensis]